MHRGARVNPDGSIDRLVHDKRIGWRAADEPPATENSLDNIVADMDQTTFQVE